MTLPYENATTGKNAIGEIQAILKGFGATKFGVMEDFDAGDVMVQFEHRDRRVTVKASIRGYAAAWLREHPYSFRMRCTQGEHQKKAEKQAQISVWSILRDWIKGQVTAVEVGILSFEGAFLAQIHTATGETVLERIERNELLALGKPKS